MVYGDGLALVQGEFGGGLLWGLLRVGVAWFKVGLGWVNGGFRAYLGGFELVSGVFGFAWGWFGRMRVCLELV